MKFDRAYVAKKDEIDAMAKASGLDRRNVKCGEVDGEHISAPAWSMREGGMLAVFDLTAFGQKRDEMLKGVQWVQSKPGCDVVEVETGRRAGTGVEMLDAALRRVHRENKKLTPERARELTTARHAKNNPNRMPDAEARAIWGNRTKYPSDGQALMNMTGWSRSTAHYRFGGRIKVEKALIEEAKAARQKRAPAKKSKRK